MKRKKKINCPNCGRPVGGAYTRYYPTTNVRVKYFKCPCGCRLKSREVFTPQRAK